jgi:hypothetical protein
MKITAQHYNCLENAITPIMQKTPLANYLEKGLTEKRWRWDLLWNWDREARTAWVEEVYTYCDDTHIDTALRKITRTHA